MNRLRLFTLSFLFLSLLVSFAPSATIEGLPSGYPLNDPPRQGKDIALFFAVNTYDNYKNLDNPIPNAEKIAQELSSRFDFTTKVFKNPTLDEIENTLKSYKAKYQRGELDPTGQLLIFFSGHGIKDYFIAADTEKGVEHRTGLSYNYWRKTLEEFNCKHILIAIDACYSITFNPKWDSKGGPDFTPPKVFGERDQIINRHEKLITRRYMTSDATEDQTPDNSRFAYEFLAALREGVRPDGLLFNSDVEAKILHTNPPGYAGAFGSDEPGSTFLFFKKESKEDPVQKEKDFLAWKAAEKLNTIEAYKQYQASFPNGIYYNKAYQVIQKLQENRDWIIAKDLNDPDYYLSRHPYGSYADEANTLNKSLHTSDIEPHQTTTTPAADNMIYIEGDTFTMGCTSEQGGDCTFDEKTAHEVTVSSFYLGRYEVTNAEFCGLLNEEGNKTEGGTTWLEIESDYCDIEKVNGKYKPKSGYESHPVRVVSWYGAKAYCAWLSKKSGSQYRLPTEAEWEFAARGGKKSNGYKYAGSEDVDKVAWYGSNSDSKTHRVGQKSPNELGLYDMSGNVWEWCSDRYGTYRSNSQRNPEGPKSGSYRVSRGGSWSGSAGYCRVSGRHDYSPERRHNFVGFRLARR